MADEATSEDKAAEERLQARVDQLSEEFFAEVAASQQEASEGAGEEIPSGAAIIGVAVRRIMGLEAGIEVLVDRVRDLEGKPPLPPSGD
jgi:hypothetical protein